jgi:hypothetical protein
VTLVRCTKPGDFSDIRFGAVYTVRTSDPEYFGIDLPGRTDGPFFYKRERFEVVPDQPAVAQAALPTDSTARKAVPLCAGVLDYFPAALAEVAKVSKAGNDKHNPGQPLHHARGKSMDHADCIARHLLERGTVDPSDGLTHTAHLAWRALALLQEELEAEGAPLARGAKAPQAGQPGTGPSPASRSPVAPDPKIPG